MKLNPKPISRNSIQTYIPEAQSHTCITNPIPDLYPPIPNLYAANPILERFSGRLRYNHIGYWLAGSEPKTPMTWYAVTICIPETAQTRHLYVTRRHSVHRGSFPSSTSYHLYVFAASSSAGNFGGHGSEKEVWIFAGVRDVEEVFGRSRSLKNALPSTFLFELS